MKKNGLDFFFKRNINIILLIISILYSLAHSANFFFWDTISQVSAPANWYYNNNFSSLLVPDEIATGHPPFFALFLAIIWKIFGKSLLVSHLTMVPFIFGILYQAHRLIRKSETGYGNQAIILAVIFADATLLSQLSMITFDIVQLFLFLWCINSILEYRRVALAVAFAGLCLISLRGSIAASGIVVFSLLRDLLRSEKIKVKSLLPYVPGFLLLGLFLLYFYLQKHWIVHNTVSGRWEQSAEFAAPFEILRNGVIIIWRLADFGRIGISIVFMLILLMAVKKKNLSDRFLSDTVLIAVSQLIIIAPFLLFSRNFIGHRYLLPVIVMISVSVIYWILEYSEYPKTILTSVLLILLSGHFWIYPLTVAQGWDATTAHWPYYRIRNEMIDYLKSEDIPVRSVGTFFPNLAKFDDIDLSGSTEVFKETDIERDSLVLFSNIFNVPDPVINELYSSGYWTERKFIGKCGVYLVLFERKEKRPFMILIDN